MKRVQELVRQANALFEEEKYLEALEAYENAFAIEKEHLDNSLSDDSWVEIGFKLGKFLIEIGDKAEALSSFQRLITVTSNDRLTQARAYFEIGRIHFDDEEWLDALTNFNLAQEHLWVQPYPVASQGSLELKTALAELVAANQTAAREELIQNL